MHIECPCPGCGRTLSVPADFAGRGVRCRHCGTGFDISAPTQPKPAPVPDSDVILEDHHDEPEDEEPVPYIPRRRRKRGVSSGVLIAVGFLALITLVMVVAAVIRHDRPSNPKAPTAGKDVSTDTKGKGRPVPAEPSVRPEPELKPVERSVEQDVGRNETIAGYPLFGAICVFVVLFVYGLLSILMAIWVVGDTRNRSVENGLFWMLLIIPFNFTALLVYLASRPKGLLIRCERCGNKRLAFVGICPHCRQPVKSRGRGA
jgi:hypothetical protein